MLLTVTVAFFFAFLLSSIFECYLSAVIILCFWVMFFAAFWVLENVQSVQPNFPIFLDLLCNAIIAVFAPISRLSIYYLAKKGAAIEHPHKEKSRKPNTANFASAVPPNYLVEVENLEYSQKKIAAISAAAPRRSNGDKRSKRTSIDVSLLRLPPRGTSAAQAIRRARNSSPSSASEPEVVITAEVCYQQVVDASSPLPPTSSPEADEPGVSYGSSSSDAVVVEHVSPKANESLPESHADEVICEAPQAVQSVPLDVLQEERQIAIRNWELYQEHLCQLEHLEQLQRNVQRAWEAWLEECRRRDLDRLFHERQKQLEGQRIQRIEEQKKRQEIACLNWLHGQQQQQLEELRLQRIHKQRIRQENAYSEYLRQAGVQQQLQQQPQQQQPQSQQQQRQQQQQQLEELRLQRIQQQRIRQEDAYAEYLSAVQHDQQHDQQQHSQAAGNAEMHMGGSHESQVRIDPEIAAIAAEIRQLVAQSREQNASDDDDHHVNDEDLNSDDDIDEEDLGLNLEDDELGELWASFNLSGLGGL